MQIIFLTVFLIFVPICIGSLINWHKKEKNLSKYVYQLEMGFFFMVAIFQLLEVPIVILNMRFTVLVWIYSIVLIAIILISLYRFAKNKGKVDTYCLPNVKEILQNRGWFFILLFVIVLSYQLYHTALYETTIMSLDDATYVANSNAAVQNDVLFLNHPYYGSEYKLEYKRVLQSFPIFLAYISKITGIHVTIICHTIMPCYLLVMAYGVYYLIASKLIDKKENVFLFLFFLSLMFTFGYFSHYSTTFRLLGVLWQGKAVLAVILNYLILYVMSICCKEGYSKKNGILMMILSIAAIALTLGGAISVAVVSAIVCILFSIRKRCGRNLLFLLWANLMPIGYVIIYLSKG